MREGGTRCLAPAAVVPPPCGSCCRPYALPRRLPTPNPRTPNPTRRLAQKAAKKKLEKLERQALGWGGFDDTLKPQQAGLGRGRWQGAVGAARAACSAASEPQRARR